VPNSQGVVLHFSDCYEPRTGGIETQVAHLARAQRAVGMNVQVVTATVGNRVNDLHRITASIPFELPVHPRTRARVAELVTRLQPAVAHVHVGVTSPFAWGALRALTEMKIPTVVTVHSMWGAVARAGYSVASPLLWRKGLHPQIIWSAVSLQAAARVESSLDVPVAQLPNGIDVDAWRCLPSRTGHTRFISVLRMAPRKRIFALLGIIERIQGQVPESTTVLIGAGPLLARAKKLSGRKNLNIEFKGRLKPAQIRAEFGTSDVFLQASVHESFGIAALEARTAGLVVLARQGTGTASFITNEVNGYITNSDSSMAEIAIRLAGNRAAIDTIKDFNHSNPPPFGWDSVVSISKLLYESAQQRSDVG